MTATQTSVSDDVPDMHTYVDKAQRHPLPARPPKEVCLNIEAQSPLPSIVPEFRTPQQTITVEHRHRSSTPQTRVTTAHIDPEILNHASCSSATPPTKASSCQEEEEEEEDVDTASISETSSVLPSTFDNVLPAENSGQHFRGELVATHRQTASVTKSCHTRKKPLKSGFSRRALRETTSHKSPNFSSVRSQFFAMSLQDRLQFVSWLFEGALSQCVSQPMGADTASASNCGAFDPDTMHNLAQPIIDWFPHQGSRFEPQVHGDRPLCEPGENELEGDQLEYEIEKILTHRNDAHGSVSYLVKWKGYGDVDATWEPGFSLRDTVALENYELELAIKADRVHETPDSNRTADRAQSKAFVTRRPHSIAKGSSTCSNPITRKGLAWSLEEVDFLTKLKAHNNLPWSAIHRRFTQRFPGRSKGSLQVYWSTKMKDNLQETRFV
ncbi:Chromo domain/shadow [Penicillium griseofulvum]|uniref:Chromo domain/shadow n=1 Tax=Penicillium patulum TaxID=5078 RepID=A0A135LKA5_PENPA|nr:Chromo domain/shadow [Penicillium griseofulvum]KXG49407.1 Chromo domain/shadow [Penicillium griseofulvum]